jgi:hypothetical protein
MPQLLALSEFCGRNCLSLESADHCIATGLDAAKCREIKNAWGEMWEFPVQYHFFNIENSEDLTFPAWTMPSERSLDGLNSDEKIRQLTHKLSLIENSRFWKLRTNLAGIFKRT